ncbi:DUF4838 domain-containing protein, partial [Candidatus Kaiserbacteria bacterium]|nr:DUF4838 domain-containing protein [Candidatus Kaiserbacteria bacterium]
PLSVTFTSPDISTTPAVAGVVNLAATASSTSSITGVQFKLDGVNLGPKDTIPPYTATWNSASSTGAWHAINATASDAAGNVASTTMNLKIQNTPYLSAVPAPGAYKRSPQTIYLSASTTIRYRRDGIVPTCASGNLYSGGINIATSTIIRAIACKGTKAASPVISFAYDIFIPSYSYGGRIVVVGPAAATSTVLSPAVADLQKYLKQMTSFDYNNLGQYPGIYSIQLILASSPLAPADAVAQLNGKGFEAFVIRSDATQLKIIANNERGLDHGIYYYLEQLGVRWLLPSNKWTIVPKKYNVTLTIDKLVEPAYSLNRSYAGTGGFFSYAFGRRHVGSGIFAADTADWQRRLRYSREYHLGKAMGEAFITTNVTTLQAHPEYLAKIDGKYSPLYLPNGNLNVTAKINAGNPEAVNYYCDSIMKGYRAARKVLGVAATTMSVEPSDGTGEGNNVSELVAAGVGDGSSSDQEFFIINACARKLKAEFPDANAITLAYAAHADPPTFPLESNVFVQPAFAFRIGPKTANLDGDQWVALWSTKVSTMGIYDYWSIPDWTHDEPSFNYLTVGSMIRNFYAKKIKGINAESTYSMGAMGIGHYVASHVMWDTTIDDTKLIDEWYTLAFGPAKAPMKRMMERWATSYRPISAELGTSYQDIQQAENLAANNPAVQARIDDYARYLHYLRLRVELVNAQAVSTTTASPKATELATHLFNIDESHMVQTMREFDLLVSRGPGYPELVNQFHLHDPNVANDPPDGPGWAAVHPLSHADVMNLITDGASKYPLPDFTIKKYTGNLVPLTPITWTAPTTTDPWGPFMGSAGALDIDLQMPSELANFPLRVSRTLDNAVTITNDAGQTVYTHNVIGIASTTAMDEISVPLSPGHYKVHFFSSGGVKDSPFQFKTWKGVPITLTRFLAPKSYGPTLKLYFYVPKGQQKVVVYKAIGQYLKLFDSHGKTVSTEKRDANQVVVAIVPSGEDGAVWSMNYLMAPDFPSEMLTTPQTFSLEPQVLMVPSDAK